MSVTAYLPMVMVNLFASTEPASWFCPELDLFAFAPKANCLAQEISVEAQIGRCATDLIGFGAWKTSEPKGAAEAETFVDLWIDDRFPHRPKGDKPKNPVADTVARTCPQGGARLFGPE